MRTFLTFSFLCLLYCNSALAQLKTSGITGQWEGPDLKTLDVILVTLNADSTFSMNFLSYGASFKTNGRYRIEKKKIILQDLNGRHNKTPFNEQNELVLKSKSDYLIWESRNVKLTKKEEQ